MNRTLVEVPQRIVEDAWRMRKFLISGGKKELWAVIVYAYEFAGWSREEIADWLEEFEITRGIGGPVIEETVIEPVVEVVPEVVTV